MANRLEDLLMNDLAGLLNCGDQQHQPGLMNVHHQGMSTPWQCSGW